MGCVVGNLAHCSNSYRCTENTMRGFVYHRQVMSILHLSCRRVYTKIELGTFLSNRSNTEIALNPQGRLVGKHDRERGAQSD